MPKLKNISEDTYKLMGKYIWHPGEVLEVAENIAAHVLEAQAERFELVPDEPEGESTVTNAPNRQQTKGRTRFRR